MLLDFYHLQITFAEWEEGDLGDFKQHTRST